MHASIHRADVVPALAVLSERVGLDTATDGDIGRTAAESSTDSSADSIVAMWSNRCDTRTASDDSSAVGGTGHIGLLKAFA